MKYLIVIQAEVPGSIGGWEIFPDDGRNVRPFLDICLSDLKDAQINGFSCSRLGGPDIEAAIKNCATVAEGDEIAELLA